MNESKDDLAADDGWETEDEADSESTAAQSEPEDDLEDRPEDEDSGTDDREPEEEQGRRRRRRRRNEDYYPEHDERAMLALSFMTDVIREMEVDCRVRLRRPRDDDSRQEISVEVVGRDAGRIIGKRGQVLSALQFLLHRVINRPGIDRRPVLVDAEGYRSRRDSSLASMARRLGKQAVEEGKIITFEPMNPRDRRVVHLALAKFEGVVTKSDGEGDARRVQIIPVRRQD